MKILSATVENFGSYDRLEFSFDSRGLCLISGPTGSGKSTLCDIIPWILFGKTAKGGTVDEVCRWDSSAPTVGKTRLLISGTALQIFRMRGPKISDLFFSIGTDDLSQNRGKDLQETQALINERLGVDFETYLSGAYFHEFSQAASFFVAPAKSRREIIDQVVDMSLATKLMEGNKSYKSLVNEAIIESEAKVLKLETQFDHLKMVLSMSEDNALRWAEIHERKVTEAKSRLETFEEDKARRIDELKASYAIKKQRLEFEIHDLNENLTPIEKLQEHKDFLQNRLNTLGESKCQSCGAPLNIDKRMIIEKDLRDVQNKEHQNEMLNIRINSVMSRIEQLSANYETEVEKEKASPNPFASVLESLSSETNPHLNEVVTYERQLKSTEKFLKDARFDLGKLKQDFDDSKVLSTAIDLFRGQLVKNTINMLEVNCNKKLQDYFDAEIRVKFEVSDKDKIDVNIYKDGNNASYTQLSKGQRQLLRLSFGTSIMDSVANAKGTHFSTIFIDEGLDGLDEVLKVKAFRLLQELATKHDSVFVVEHSTELKNMFETQFQVRLENGTSVVTEI